MELKLSEELYDIDPSLYLTINYNGVLLELGVASEEIGRLYTYSTTDEVEAYSKISEFIDCLKSPDKFDNLIKNILEEPLEV